MLLSDAVAAVLGEEAFKHLSAASRAGNSSLPINAAAGFYTRIPLLG